MDSSSGWLPLAHFSSSRSWGNWSGCLTRSPTKGQRLKLRLPRFLTPRRKYEVDESLWLVKFGRPKVETLLRWSRKAIAVGRSLSKTVAPRLRQMSVYGSSIKVSLAHQVRKPILFVQWGRMPKEWELSFVSAMKSTESQGIPFSEVLRTDLPLVLGEAPAEVLLRWVGRRARREPKHFAKAVAEMFGRSGKPIIVRLENTLDPEKMLEAHREPENPFQSVIDAIQRADAEKSNPIEYLREVQKSHA